LTATRDAYDERLVDQGGQQVEHVRALDVVIAAHRLGSLEREAAGEDRQSVEQGPLPSVEQVVAPVQRRQ
jgi:hypothetical protein